MVESQEEVQFSIQGMDCADCALSLERSLAQIRGVEQVTVNFTTGLLDARGNFEPQDIIRRAVQMLPAERACPCGSALQHAIITDRAAISEEARRRLDLLIGRHLA